METHDSLRYASPPSPDPSPMTALTDLIRDLVVANRILAAENVVDAYGHVSVRHPQEPDRFLIACSLAPELVGEPAILELHLDAPLVKQDGSTLHHGRLIH